MGHLVLLPLQLLEKNLVGSCFDSSCVCDSCMFMMGLVGSVGFGNCLEEMMMGEGATGGNEYVVVVVVLDDFFFSEPPLNGDLCALVLLWEIGSFVLIPNNLKKAVARIIGCPSLFGGMCPLPCPC